MFLDSEINSERHRLYKNNTLVLFLCGEKLVLIEGFARLIEKY